MLEIKCYAKVNLALDVLKRLENGYHELKMVMVLIDLYDRLEISISEEMSFTCNKKYITDNSNNTVLKAVSLMREKYKFKENFKINLIKVIPTKAGLAGGSSNGAMVVKAICELLNIKMSDEDVKEICLKIGADVYYMYHQKPALVEGIGDVLTFFKNNLHMNILVIKPKQGISTKLAYESLDIDNLKHFDVNKVYEGLQENDYEKVIDNMGNSLESSAFKLCNKIAAFKNELLNFPLDNVLMSGSGSSLMCFSKDVKLLKKICEQYRKKGYFARVCHIVDL